MAAVLAALGTLANDIAPPDDGSAPEKTPAWRRAARAEGVRTDLR